MTDGPHPSRSDGIGRTVTVVYDGDCPVCRLTIRALRILDWRQRLEFTPLQQFQPRSPGDPNRRELMRALHVRDGGGAWRRGGDAAHPGRKRRPDPRSAVAGRPPSGSAGPGRCGLSPRGRSSPGDQQVARRGRGSIPSEPALGTARRAAVEAALRIGLSRRPYFLAAASSAWRSCSSTVSSSKVASSTTASISGLSPAPMSSATVSPSASAAASASSVSTSPS